jgi:o-succinylbenzoate synthase
MKPRLQVGERAALLELTAAGVIGRGEIAPLPGYSTETLGDALGALDGIDFELDLPDSEALAGIRAAIAPLIEPAPSAAFAIETALLAILAARRGCTVASLLGARPGSEIKVNALVGSVDEAARACERGIDTFKVKLDRAASNIPLLVELRQRFGDAVTLRADANRAWTVAEAEAHMDALAPVGLELIEEPVSEWPASWHPPLPVALDESLRHDAEERITAAADALVAVVLKPANLGGVLRSMEIAAHARALGIDAIVTHMRGGPIELASCRALAAALACRRACGLDPHPGLAAWTGGPP